MLRLLWTALPLVRKHDRNLMKIGSDEVGAPLV